VLEETLPKQFTCFEGWNLIGDIAKQVKFWIRIWQAFMRWVQKFWNRRKSCIAQVGWKIK